MPEFIDVGTPDFMSRSSILRLHGSKRAFFDAKKPEHLASLKRFIETGNWGTVQFYPEYPFTDVPMTVLMKFAGHHLKATRETPEERVEKLIGLRAAGEVTLFEAAPVTEFYDDGTPF
jgi:hypothetical protein